MSFVKEGGVKDTSFNLRIDPELKSAFVAAAQAEDRPAAQILRDFMRAFVRRREERAAFVAEAARQSAILRAAAADPDSGEEELMRWVEAVQDLSGWEA
jgi:predicted transcriptional regulator